MQEVITYLGVHNAVYQCLLSPIDHLITHPSMHMNGNLRMPSNINKPRLKICMQLLQNLTILISPSR